MKVFLTRIVKTACVAAAMLNAESALSQTTDSQVFNVVVPQLVSIVAPATETIDTNNPANQIDGSMSFLATDPWQVTCNDAAGATVTFVAQGPFTNSAGGSSVNAALSIFGISSDPNSVWTTSIPTSATSGPGTTATVMAESTGAGPASFDVDIVFQNTGLYSDLVAGTYTTTVVGTISGNTP